MKKNIQTLIILMSIAFSLNLLAEKKQISRQSNTVKQKVSQLVKQTIDDIKKIKKVDDRVAINQKLIQSIREARLSVGLQTPEDEFYLDMLVDTLKAIPVASNFKLESCGEYKSEILRLFDPKSEGKTEHPPVNQGLEVLKNICAK